MLFINTVFDEAHWVGPADYCAGRKEILVPTAAEGVLVDCPGLLAADDRFGEAQEGVDSEWGLGQFALGVALFGLEDHYCQFWCCVLFLCRFFDNDLSKVPTQALTMGVGTIMDAKEVIIMAGGPNKAEAIYQAIEGHINHKWTVTALQMHPAGTIICDKEAASKLSPQTIEYFLSIENRVA